jgi:hypothetical protein
VLSFAVLGVLLMRAWKPAGDTGSVQTATQRDVPGTLARWSMAPPSRAHLTLDSVLTPKERDWLAAIQRAGTSVTWSGRHMAATAVTLTRVADPAGASELAAAAPAGSTMRVHDRVGYVDSVVVGKYGVRLEIPGAATGVGVSVAASDAWAAVPDSIAFKRLLVEGAASWETKFTIAALAERGWKVDAITHVAPGVDVREGSPGTPDTSRYAAVIAVDSTASLIARGAGGFVRNGGGLITLHDASTVGPRSSASVLLERTADGDVRASRVGSGRVIRVGYQDLWRRRMMDDDTIPDPVAAHRTWLARAVASVAYAPMVESRVDSLADPAPLADMVDRVGPRSAAMEDHSPVRRQVPSFVLFGILLASLLLELASRRLRGAR